MFDYLQFSAALDVFLEGGNDLTGVFEGGFVGFAVNDCTDRPPCSTFYNIFCLGAAIAL